jgi:hypothetical protein
MIITIELTGTWDEILEEMQRHVGKGIDATAILDGLSLQELFAYTGQRAEAEGYDFEVLRPGEKRHMTAAEQKREEARARLRGDLEASLKVETKPEPEPEPEEEEPEPKKAPHTTPKGKAKTKTAANGNGAGPVESAADMKLRCMDRLHHLFNNEGKKAEVMKILTDFGGGAKNFSSIPEADYGPISEALAALEG